MPVKVGLNHEIKKAPAQRNCEIKKLKLQLHQKIEAKKLWLPNNLLGLKKFCELKSSGSSSKKN